MMSTRSDSDSRAGTQPPRPEPLPPDPGSGPPPRLRYLVLGATALLCVFVIAAGSATAVLLPRRLARWDVARVAGGRLATPQRRLAAAGWAGGTGAGAGLAQGGPTAAGVGAVLGPLLAAPALGSHVGLLVTSLATGKVLYAQQSAAGFAPASTTKLATAVAALHVLGPNARFTTTVVGGPTPSSVVLVGGGDPTLAGAKFPAADYPQPATLAALAARTAKSLRARGRHAVQVGYDTSLYGGPDMGPSWPNSYVTTGNVTPISALEIDQGRLTPSGAPDDADDWQNTRPRSFTPAPEAAQAFAGFLAADGIQVTGTPVAGAAPAGATRLAAVHSPPLAQIVQQMLLESNNVIAENLARHVAIAKGQPATFSGAAAAEISVLRGLGITGVQIVDGSGLSPADRIAPASLVALIRLASRQDQPRLRAAITGLPVAGFSGTLEPDGSVFAEAGPAALGVVRAKTGNLDNVAAMAGIAYARDGQLLAFAVMTDKFRSGGLDAAGVQIARLVTALAGCGCRAGG
jgi:D-alanyl-D-alanine carboxypeptidase/D-alanyl-D-alanine-endopeptidase (penicillin-binding protein 4)